MSNPTRTMLTVCQAIFSGDWQAMLRFAERYNPEAKNLGVEAKNLGVQLGRRFREIIGTRNRSQFWSSVTKCDSPAAADGVVVDGDSLRDVQRAIRLCAEGESVMIELDGKIIGKLIPAQQTQAPG